MVNGWGVGRCGGGEGGRGEAWEGRKSKSSQRVYFRSRITLLKKHHIRRKKCEKTHTNSAIDAEYKRQNIK